MLLLLLSLHLLLLSRCPVNLMLSRSLDHSWSHTAWRHVGSIRLITGRLQMLLHEGARLIDTAHGALLCLRLRPLVLLLLLLLLLLLQLGLQLIVSLSLLIHFFHHLLELNLHLVLLKALLLDQLLKLLDLLLARQQPRSMARILATILLKPGLMRFIELLLVTAVI